MNHSTLAEKLARVRHSQRKECPPSSLLGADIVEKTASQGKEQIHHGNSDTVMKGMISVLRMQMRGEASLRWGGSLLQKPAGIPEWTRDVAGRQEAGAACGE